MEETRLIIPGAHLAASYGVTQLPVSGGDFVAMGFRWRNRIIVVFLLTLVGAGAAAWFWPKQYESVMKILVRRDRLDPPVTAASTYGAAEVHPDLTEEELNTEVNLLRADDILRQVVLATGVEKETKAPLWYRLSRQKTANSRDVRIAAAIRGLSRKLDIVVPKKSDLITVSYTSSDPQMAAGMLIAVSKAYLDRHAILRRPAGQFEFFDKQAKDYQRKLADAEGQLARFPYGGGTVAGPQEVDMAVRKAGELKQALQETMTSIQETSKQIATLEAELASTPPRTTTAMRRTDNEQLMMQLNSTLLNLQLKRTELLQKFAPTYWQVEEVEQEIAKTQAAIDSANKTPLRDETTDRDPTYEWMRSELAKAKTTLTTLFVRATSLSEDSSEAEIGSRKLNESSLKQQDLTRTVKNLEETYQLYLRKREEARIGDALDRMKILNVLIAQEPTVPVLPTGSTALRMLLALLLAIVFSIAIAVVSEHLDRSLRTADEVRNFLNIEVLAALPAGYGESAAGARELQP